MQETAEGDALSQPPDAKWSAAEPSAQKRDTQGEAAPGVEEQENASLASNRSSEVYAVSLHEKTGRMALVHSTLQEQHVSVGPLPKLNGP
jgi:hypothetical protein